VICTRDHCDPPFCALQLTALIKPNWCFLLYCCACLYPNTILIEAGWTTAPWPATNLSIWICKSSERTKQSVISVTLETPLEIRLRICIYKMSLLYRLDDYVGITPSCVTDTLWSVHAWHIRTPICWESAMRRSSLTLRKLAFAGNQVCKWALSKGQQTPKNPNIFSTQY